jgi:hypothetical protein
MDHSARFDPGRIGQDIRVTALGRNAAVRAGQGSVGTLP